MSKKWLQEYAPPMPRQFGGPLGILPDALGVWDELMKSKGDDLDQVKEYLMERQSEWDSLPRPATQEEEKEYAKSLMETLLAVDVQHRLVSRCNLRCSRLTTSQFQVNR